MTEPIIKFINEKAYQNTNKYNQNRTLSIKSNNRLNQEIYSKITM